MFGFKRVLSAPLNRSINCSLNLNLVASKRWIETSTNRKEESNKDNSKDTGNVNKNENLDDKKNKALQEQEKLFSQFTSESGLSIEDKQDRFLDMLFRFRDQNIYNQRLGDCEFVLGSLKILKPLGLHRELEVYKQLLSVFPKEKMKTENYYQKMFQHYPKHQETALELLDEMGHNDVVPDKELRIIVRDIFGGFSFVHKKVLMMNYWNSKLRRRSQFPIPDQEIDDRLELARLALKKMCCDADAETKIQKYDSSIAQIDEHLENEWILSAQSRSQKALINRLDEIVYVEGPFTCFVQYDQYVKYFVLKTNTPNLFEFEFERGKLDVSRMKISIFGRKKASNILEDRLRLHFQEEGAILATCITEKSSESSILAWVRILCKLNKNLENLQIVFNFNKDNE